MTSLLLFESGTSVDPDHHIWQTHDLLTSPCWHDVFTAPPTMLLSKGPPGMTQLTAASEDVCHNPASAKMQSRHSTASRRAISRSM